jgi:hypothetical protein
MADGAELSQNRSSRVHLKKMAEALGTVRKGTASRVMVASRPKVSFGQMTA